VERPRRLRSGRRQLQRRRRHPAAVAAVLPLGAAIPARLWRLPALARGAYLHPFVTCAQVACLPQAQAARRMSFELLTGKPAIHLQDVLWRPTTAATALDYLTEQAPGLMQRCVADLLLDAACVMR